MEPSSLNIYCTKDWQKWTRGEKVTSPQSMGGQFYRKFLTKERISKPLKKSLNITLLPLVLQDDL
jgi:hypothetical protein